MRARHRMRAAAVAAVVLAAAAFAGSVVVLTRRSPHPLRVMTSPASTGGDTNADVVSWVDRPADRPAETTTTTVAFAPDCTQDALTIVDAGGGGAGGTNRFYVTIKSQDSSSCVLRSVTSATGRHSGRRVALNLTVSEPTVLQVAPLGFVRVMFETPDACGPNRDQLPTDRYDAIVLSLHGVSLDVPELQLAACGNGFETYLIAYMPPAPAPAPGTIEALTATIEPDYHLTNGILNFVVDLHNPTGVPVQLDACPVYTEYLAEDTPSHAYFSRTYELNCDTIHQIRPQSSVRYGMRLQLPTTARSGKLGWQLGAVGSGEPATAVEASF
ncbi:MAG: hypothetical protein M3Q30_18635 [Actinomycetota bacterium]|nr:hypothetical protein [Actinomycetota bacterium]